MTYVIDEKTTLAAAVAAPVAAAAPELCVVIPTFNEKANVGLLVQRIERAMAGTPWEVVVVDDDSPDGTAAAVRALAAEDARVRCLQRLGRRGLASACVEGMLATAAPYLAVIDADLQHDETLLPAMLDVLRRGETDVVIGSRYQDSTEVPGWDESRQRMSRVATRLGKLLLRADVADPMSGFFMIRREAFEPVARHLSGTGFKLLLDILASAPEPLRVRELPYTFGLRQNGESKLDTRVALDFLMMTLDKLTGGIVPARFILFAGVGAAGVLVHLAVLQLAFVGAGLSFIVSQTVATLVAMTSNYAVNNELTYRDRRLRGAAWLRGWVSFVLACGFGAVANVGVSATLYADATPWLLSALAGIAVGVVWNYVVTAFYVWKG